MDTSPLHRVRNIGIMAHIDAGKTTTSERILYYTGKSHKLGEVHEGTTVLDWMVQERERGITITSAATTFSWGGCTMNLIDTPGHVDFTAEVERSLRVLDGAVAVFDAANGVEPQSETVWRQADRYRVPRIVFLNKMDKVGASLEYCLESMETRLGVKATVLQLPLGTEGSFCGVIDILRLQSWTWETDDRDTPPKVGEVPEDMRTEALLYRQELLETLADYDDTLAQALLDDAPVSNEALLGALRKGVIALRVTPVFLGSSFKNKGIQPLLDAVVDFLPSPLDVPPPTGLNSGEIRAVSPEAPVSALVFKLMTDPFVGTLHFVRVYSGTLRAGASLLNVPKGKKERPSKILRMHANDREEIQSAGPGEIVAVVGLKWSTTGDTLADPEHPIVYESMVFPAPVVSISLEPKVSGDLDRLQAALARLVQEDPSLHMGVSSETGQLVLSGMGELHLQIIADRLTREFKVEANVGKPQVAYRESLRSRASASSTFSRIHQGKTFQATVHLEVAPAGGTAATVELPPAPQGVPPGIPSGIREALQGATGSGPLCGYALVGARVRVLSYSQEPGAWDEVVYKVAATAALREALGKAGPLLMEPIMAVEVLVPPEFSGNIVSDVKSRRGQITSLETRGHLQVVHADIPLSELFGYETAIRSSSQGRASSSMVFSAYGAVPPALQDKILGLS